MGISTNLLPIPVNFYRTLCYFKPYFVVFIAWENKQLL